MIETLHEAGAGSPCSFTHEAPESLVGCFSSMQSFLRSVVYGPVWIETIARLVPLNGGALHQYGVYLSALGPLRLPQRPVFCCTRMAATLYREASGPSLLLAPYRASQVAFPICEEIRQRLFEAALASLKESQHVSHVVPHASWSVPFPWSKVARGFVYREGSWQPEEAQACSL